MKNLKWPITIIFWIIAFICFYSSASAQLNSNAKVFTSTNVNDSTTARLHVNTMQSVYGDLGGLYYNKQSSKWKVYQDSVWYDLIDTTGGGGGTPALPFNSIQYNNAGAFGGNAGLTYVPATPLLTAAGLYIFKNSSGSIGITGTGFTAPTLMGGSNVGIGNGTFNVINVAATGNTSIGTSTGLKLSTGDDNTYLGNQAGQEITTGNNNITVGANAGQGITTGSNNTFLGRLTGGSVTTESNNVLIGSTINIPAGGSDNQLSIQNAIYGINNSGTGTTLSTGRIGLYVSNPLARLHLPAGSTTALTAPLKFNSGSLMTTPETGAFEFLTDKYYGSITTGTARKEFSMNDISLTSGRIPFTTTNGRFTDNSNLTYSTSAFNIQTSSTGAITTPTFTATGTSASTGVINLGTGGTPLNTLNSTSITTTLNASSIILNGETDISFFSPGGTITSNDGLDYPGTIDLTTSSGTNSRFGDLVNGLFEVQSTGTLYQGNTIELAPTGTGDIKLTVSSPSGRYIIIGGLPTSSAGLPSGAIWSNSNVLTIVP